MKVAVPAGSDGEDLAAVLAVGGEELEGALAGGRHGLGGEAGHEAGEASPEVSVVGGGLALADGDVPLDGGLVARAEAEEERVIVDNVGGRCAGRGEIRGEARRRAWASCVPRT